MSDTDILFLLGGKCHLAKWSQLVPCRPHKKNNKKDDDAQ